MHITRDEVVAIWLALDSIEVGEDMSEEAIQESFRAQTLCENVIQKATRELEGLGR